MRPISILPLDPRPIARSALPDSDPAGTRVPRARHARAPTTRGKSDRICRPVDEPKERFRTHSNRSAWFSLSHRHVVRSHSGRKSLRDNIFDNSHRTGKQADNRPVRLPGRRPRPAQV